jgi:hypothetical protein
MPSSGNMVSVVDFVVSAADLLLCKHLVQHFRGTNPSTRETQSKAVSTRNWTPKPNQPIRSMYLATMQWDPPSRGCQGGRQGLAVRHLSTSSRSPAEGGHLPTEHDNSSKHVFTTIPELFCLLIMIIFATVNICGLHWWQRNFKITVLAPAVRS